MPLSPEEIEWFAAQHALVEEYLGRERVEHRGVARFPSFHVYPSLALWAVQSKQVRATAAWWAISGDLPTDYLPRSAVAEPREALQRFSNRWREIADYMKRGEAHPSATMGPREKWPQLAPLLRARADAVLFLAADDSLWIGPPDLE